MFSTTTAAFEFAAQAKETYQLFEAKRQLELARNKRDRLVSYSYLIN